MSNKSVASRMLTTLRVVAAWNQNTSSDRLFGTPRLSPSVAAMQLPEPDRETKSTTSNISALTVGMVLVDLRSYSYELWDIAESAARTLSMRHSTAEVAHLRLQQFSTVSWSVLNTLVIVNITMNNGFQRFSRLCQHDLLKTTVTVEIDAITGSTVQQLSCTDASSADSDKKPNCPGGC